MAVLTAPSCILAVVTALLSNSAVSTAPLAIFALVTASVLSLAVLIAPSCILAVVTFPSKILAVVTDPFCNIAVVTVLSLGVPIPTVDPMTVTKMLAPLAGADPKIMSLPTRTNPSLGWLDPALGF